ncbi:hypothetical protein AN958_01852 [Leucoagaricus sp. SymC.cos]|nr:hypothetical protein AN958_01852 [Leucoagaricus sp. SymC.cos]
MREICVEKYTLASIGIGAARDRKGKQANTGLQKREGRREWDIPNGPQDLSDTG